jgi:hypothetical protein
MGGKMKNREKWRRIVQEAKAHLDVWRRGEGRKEGRKEGRIVYVESKA